MCTIAMTEAADNRVSVLLVDDDAAVARLSSRLLERLGHAVETFLDPRKAFDRLTQAPDAFDVLITDHRMPGMTGQELLVRLRRAGVAIPAMMVSGFSDEIDRDVLAQIGVQSILDKPFTRDQMRETLEQLLSGGNGASA